MQLPEGACIHLVFHVSLLKPFHQASSSTTPAPLSLPATAKDNQPIISPLAFISTHKESTFSDSKLQAFVQWTSLPLEDTIWEDWEQLRLTYHLEDKVLLEAHGNDRPNNISNTPTIAKARPKRQHNTPTYLKDFV